MILVYCTGCYTGVRVLGDEAEIFPLVGHYSEFWPSAFKCVACDGPARGVLELELASEDLARLKLVELTGPELFATQMGLGLPTEQCCDFESVRDLFLRSRVVRVKGVTVPHTTRTAIECLFFEDGTRLYMGSSPQGAIVYRIAKPFVGSL